MILSEEQAMARDTARAFARELFQRVPYIQPGS